MEPKSEKKEVGEEAEGVVGRKKGNREIKERQRRRNFLTKTEKENSGRVKGRNGKWPNGK